MVIIFGMGFGQPAGDVFFAEQGLPLIDYLAAGVIKAKVVNWTNQRIWVIVPDNATSGPVYIRAHCGAESNRLDFTVRK